MTIHSSQEPKKLTEKLTEKVEETTQPTEKVEETTQPTEKVEETTQPTEKVEETTQPTEKEHKKKPEPDIILRPKPQKKPEPDIILRPKPQKKPEPDIRLRPKPQKKPEPDIRLRPKPQKKPPIVEEPEQPTVEKPTKPLFLFARPKRPFLKKRQRPFRKRPSRKPLPLPLIQIQSGKQIDYKDSKLLRQFTSDQGQILSRKATGLDLKQQRLITLAIKKARILSFLPFIYNDKNFERIKSTIIRAAKFRNKKKKFKPKRKNRSFFSKKKIGQIIESKPNSNQNSKKDSYTIFNKY